MTHQISWKTLPGLRGLACSDFRAVATDTPDNERGVALDFASDAERDELLAALEARFGAERFTNTASAFDTVKAFAIEWHARRA